MSNFENISQLNSQKVVGQKEYTFKVLGEMTDKRYAEMAEQLTKMGDDPTPGELMQQQAYSILFEVTSNVIKSISDAIGTSNKTLAQKG
jgi:hypothetical protein